MLPPVLNALEALAYVGRHLHPPNLPSLAGAVADNAEPVRTGLAQFKAADFPESFANFKDCVIRTAEHVLSAHERLDAAAGGMNGAMGGYRAMGEYTRAVQALYPVAAMLPPVSRFFVSKERRSDEALAAKLGAADGARAEVGIMIGPDANETSDGDDRRGGFALYVPEYYDATESYPLIVALHGGSGNGKSFLWTWLVEARTRGAILLSPTAIDRTWSLMGPDIDSANIEGMVKRVQERWNIDAGRMLLTGMSDGGTFSYVSGLREESPFTHLAPSSASFHPLLLEGMSRERLKGLPIYLMHGALDWMFPVDIARTANAALSAAGADVVYREIADLSHTWPRDENPRIVDWLMGN